MSAPAPSVSAIRAGDPLAIESTLHEDRIFPPPADLAERLGPLHVASMERYQSLWRRSIEDPEGFWGGIASEFDWFRPWTSVLAWECPDARWFVGGRTNICHNCLDRQVLRGHGDEVALIWEGEPLRDSESSGPGAPGVHEVRHLSYAELLREVSRFANVLRALGVRKGEVVTIYMGMVPELMVAMLACARIGAAHSVIFGGFSSQAIVDRVHDAASRVLVTCDGAWRRGQIVPLKENVDAACAALPGVEHVVVLARCGNPVAWNPARDHWWRDLTLAASEHCPCEWMESEDLLFLLYTSGSTGKPKGIRHTTGGYMVYTATTAKLTFNLAPGRGQVFWCTADIGWITGHSYVAYGILPNRVPTLMYEGAPNAPAEDRFWDIVARHRVTHFYTAPTAIRAFMKWGDEHPRKHDLSSLRVLGTVGEPINPEAWMWYHRVIGGERCPIVDTWWQTETGGHMITPLPGATPTVPGSCTLPALGVDAAIVDAQGIEQPPNVGGLLVIRKPWPAMLRGIHGDRDRFVKTYWSRVPGMYLAGDGARRDERGYFWIMGRIDDVINVSGHRLGTMEVESALVSHDAVVEAAVVGMPHEIKGTGVAAFCILRGGVHGDEALRASLREHVAKEIGAIAKPDLIRFTASLPKTRSGKIMRRLLRDIAAGRETTGDTTTLDDLGILAKLRDDEE
ncbi:MAG TPA: acetate--CoA ligase [Phycisphaerales bacterium]|nr:acetate--CoA ligase [Phycisphaerales bacterium]HMP36606.1 acetate--CoA ligase [Phycisphaerales bacterium]